METIIQIRFGELSTKGKNKKRFINQLTKNIGLALAEFSDVKIKPEYDYIFLDLNGTEEDTVMEKLKDIFGIQSYSPIYVIPRDFLSLREAVVDMLEENPTEGKSFKITTKRSDHTYEYDTNEINAKLGEWVLEQIPGLKVQLKRPDITVRVDVKENCFLISTKTYPGAGGLPVGTSGKGTLMLSGGIDSPVAGYLAMKRGVSITAVHFSSPPYTNPQSLQKTKDLTAKLTKFGGAITHIEVPFAEIQEEIKAEIPDGYSMTVTRRMMLRITDAIREKGGALAIFNGESLGQVASQTMESMFAINEVTTTPIIRPVGTMDKLEIIALAEKIDTFDLSIQPFEDCCTIFAPKAPKTKPHIDKVKRYEERLDVNGLVTRALEKLTVTTITSEKTNMQEKKNSFTYLL